MKFSNLAAICAATMMFAMPAGAQTADKTADKKVDKMAAETANPVVATVNGVKILSSDVDVARGQLPEQYRNLPMDQIYQPILNQLIRTKILSAQARADKLHETDTYKRRVSLVAERLLEEALLTKTVGEKVTDEALRSRYDKNSGSFPTKDEIRARHILVKTEAEADADYQGTDRRRGLCEAGGGKINWSVQGQWRRSELFQQGPDGAAVRGSSVRAGQGRIHQVGGQIALRLAYHQA